MKEYNIASEESKEDFFTNEYVRKIINETIEFDRKLQDPEFLKKIQIEEEKIKNIDLEALMERCENDEEGF